MIKTMHNKQVVIGWICLIVLLLPGKILAQANDDTLKKEVITIRDHIIGFEERLTVAENNLERRTKIRLSGYIQAQWQYFENPAMYPNNYFSVRLARLKIQYQAVEGIAFVLQPDFSPGGFVLKDAYARLNDPWLKTFSVWAGQFNRPNYEVEYSSSKREVPERSRVIRALYPGEQALGAKLEVTPPSFPVLFQLAVLNGNDHLSIRDIYGNEINPKNKDFDNFKDLMARLTYHLKLGNFGGLNVGINGYYGWIKSNSTVVLKSDYSPDETVKPGQGINRNWVGGELQLTLNVLGGISVRAEYLQGINAFPGAEGTYSHQDPLHTTLVNDTLSLTSLTTHTNQINPAIRRNFMGGYVYLIKNIGKRNQFAFRWDFYDPNTRLTRDQIGVIGYDNSSSESHTQTTIEGSNPVVVLNQVTKNVTDQDLKSGTSDITYHTLTFAWNYDFTDNLRIQLAYEIPVNEKVGVDADGKSNLIKTYTVNDQTVINDYSRVFPQNILILRLQAKF